MRPNTEVNSTKDYNITNNESQQWRNSEKPIKAPWCKTTNKV